METEDKMLALSIFFHSRKAYRILSQLFILPSVRTLLRDLQKINIKPGFSQSVLDALTLKVQAMHPTDRNVALVFDEMNIKQSLVYNEGTDSIEGFEDFWKFRKRFLLMSVESVLTNCYCLSYPQSMMNCLHMSSSEIKLTKKQAA